MICSNCGEESSLIKMFQLEGKFVERCHRCGGFSEADRVITDFTRSSGRLREQQEKHQEDFVQPHTYDRMSRKVIPNPEFIKLYPDKAKNYYSDDEIRSVGSKFADYSKAVEAKEKVNKQRVESIKEQVIEFKKDPEKLKATIKGLGGT